MTTPAPPPPAQLSDVAQKVRRHWRVVAIAAVVGVILGAAASFLLPTTYTAETTVTVNPMNADSMGSSADASQSVNMATEKQVATSSIVAEAAADLLAPQHDLTAKAVQDATTVSTPSESFVLSIGFNGSSPKLAADGANALGEAYLSNRQNNATDELDRLAKTANAKITTLQNQAKNPANASDAKQRAIDVQVDALATQLASIGKVDLSPGQVIGKATEPTSASSPGLLPLGVAGGLLGLLIGIPVALARSENFTEIGGVDGLGSLGDQVVLDGTKDTNRADTWDIAAFMVKLPSPARRTPFIIMVDAEDDPKAPSAPGQELVDALSRRGHGAQLVDAGTINEGEINRGWPTAAERDSWSERLIVLDTTHLGSDANKVALATRAHSVVLTRTTVDDAAALKRLTGLLQSNGVDPALTALFPPQAEVSASR